MIIAQRRQSKNVSDVQKIHRKYLYNEKEERNKCLITNINVPPIFLFLFVSMKKNFLFEILYVWKEIFLKSYIIIDLFLYIRSFADMMKTQSNRNLFSLDGFDFNAIFKLCK